VHGQRDSTARGELRCDDGFARRAGFHEIIENTICDSFIERALIAIRGQIELQLFTFDAQTIRHVIDIDPGEIGLACDRTNGSEIVCFEVNTVISLRSRIRKRFQARFGWRCRKFRVAVSEQC